MSTPSFAAILEQHALAPLQSASPTVLQVNMGKLCNQTCAHCHVDAGPHRREIMTRETAAHCLQLLQSSGIGTLDITGGAPELNPNFRWLAHEAVHLGRTVIDRCNLTVLLLPSQADLAGFLAAHRIRIVASLPYFTEQPADAQRGTGVFAKSVLALQLLNSMGYGKPGSGLELDLVFNPSGAFLPPSQTALEADYKRELSKRYGIVFNSLYTITNLPIRRFLDFLEKTGNYERYMQKLTAAFNPAAVEGLMCRTTISVSWDGKLYDCDFNQMLDLEIGSLATFHHVAAPGRNIVTGQHCFGCTAGRGSSCGGSLT